MPIKMLFKTVDKLNPAVSVSFKNDLSSIVNQVAEQKSVNLSTIGTHYNTAIFLANGHVKSKYYNETGDEIITRIYGPGEIFTDLNAFFMHERVSVELTTITPCDLLVLNREDMVMLKKYPETDKLKNAMFLVEKELDFQRTLMMMMKPKARFIHFAERYPFTQLQNKVCANFLNLHDSDYCTFKSNYLKR